MTMCKESIVECITSNRNRDNKLLLLMANRHASELIELRCQIDSLETENTRLQDALTTISTAMDAYGVEWCRHVAKNALENEQ